MTETTLINRRQYERTQIEKRIRLATAPKDMGSYHDAVTIDLTTHGARIRSNVTLTPGEAVEIIGESAANFPYDVHSQVVWMSKALGEAGLRFIEPVRTKTAPQAERARV